MKKTFITISCLCLVFLLGMALLDNSYVVAAQPQDTSVTKQDKEVIIATDNVQKTDNIVKQTTCLYNHENCDGIHQNQNCPNNHGNNNGNCQNQQGTNCNNTKKHKSGNGQHHRNGF